MNKPFEVQIDLEDPLVALAAGCSHTLGLGQSGMVYVWGSNKEGQLGLGAEGEESLFVPTPLMNFWSMEFLKNLHNGISVCKIFIAGFTKLERTLCRGLLYWEIDESN